VCAIARNAAIAAPSSSVRLEPRLERGENSMKMKTLLLGAGAALGMAGLGHAAVQQDHWDKFSCYAYVHDQCYANGQNNCSPADYDWGLDQCDQYYPAVVKRPGMPKNLTQRTDNIRFRTNMTKTLQKQN
jgi:hypothetical protein